jgi:hypothetical protein
MEKPNTKYSIQIYFENFCIFAPAIIKTISPQGHVTMQLCYYIMGVNSIYFSKHFKSAFFCHIVLSWLINSKFVLFEKINPKDFDTSLAML